MANRESNVRKLARMGVAVPDEWDDQKVAQTVAELREAEASEPAPQHRPASPRG